jgi:hypothetical protein
LILNSGVENFYVPAKEYSLVMKAITNGRECSDLKGETVCTCGSNKDGGFPTI